MMTRAKLWKTLRSAERTSAKYKERHTPLDWWIVESIEQEYGFLGRDQWLAARTSGIGGSDIAKIVGASPYGSALGLWGEKTGRCPPEPPADVDAVEMGHVLEPVIAERYAAKHGVRSTLWPRYTIVTDDAEPWRRCTPDALAWHDGGWELVQLKTASERERGRETPLHYVLQCQWEMTVTGIDRCHLVTLYGGRYLETKIIVAEKPLQDWLADWGRRFWQLVESKTEPTAELYAGVDPAIVAQDARRVWPRENGEIVTLSPELAEMAAQVSTLDLAIKQASERKELIQSSIKAFLGPREAAEMPDGSGVWTWREQTRKAYTVAESSTRVLRFSKSKGAKE